MKNKWFRDFLALSAAGNFRVAAQMRNVSQPALSRRIQALESWIGAPLIDRSGPHSQLTEAGKLFFPVAQKIVNLTETGKEDVQALLLEEKEKIRFATLTTLSQIFLPVWLKNLQPFIPTTRYIIKTGYQTNADYFAALEESRVDFFISYIKPNTQTLGDTSAFTSLKLGEDSFVPVACPKKDGTLRWWLPDTPKQPIPCLHTLSDDSPWPIKTHMEERYSDLNFRSVYDSSSGPTLKEMALEGFGMAWLPLVLVTDELASGRLVRVAEPADDIDVDIRIYRCLNNKEPRVDKFWQALLAQRNEQPAL